MRNVKAVRLMRFQTSASVALCCVVLAACGGGGGPAGSGPLEPSVSQANLGANKLQLAVGVATFGDDSRGLNLVATFRQPNGLAATLVNTPTLTGPFTNNAPAGSDCPGSSYAAGLGGKAYLAGFAQLDGSYMPAGAAGTDAKTHRISGSPQVPPGSNVACTSLGESGGVFEYGLSLQNQTVDQVLNVSPQFFYPQPLFAPQLQSAVPYVGGPPAYPNVRTGTYPSGFAGFGQGFLTFALGTPPPGPYSLSVLVPAANAASATFTASATIASARGLTAFSAPPTTTEDGSGGLTVAFLAPAGVTESVVDIADIGPNAGSSSPANPNAPIFYTIVAHGSGSQTVTLPPNLGPLGAGGAASPSIAPGDDYTVTVLGADYPLFEAGPPANVQQSPALLGGSGQADITFSPAGGNVSAGGYGQGSLRPALRQGRRR